MERRQLFGNGLRVRAVLFLCGMIIMLAQGGQLLAGESLANGGQTVFDSDWPIVYRFLSEKCSGCHRADNEQADYTSYEALMAAKSEEGDLIVRPGDVKNSLLWQSVVWNVHAARNAPVPNKPDMPFEEEDWLTAGQLSVLSRWIANGSHQYQNFNSKKPRALAEIDFPSAKQCKVCHPKQFREWSQSMHAYAQHSPTFEAFNLTLNERSSGTMGTFCSRCHTPIGTSLGENGLLRNVHRSRISMEGITCVTCHRRGKGHYKSSGRFVIEPGQITEGCIYGPFDAPASKEIKSHQSVQQPYIKSSQFCGECHDVTIPGGVRLEEAFSEWQNSPAARDQTTCQHCHMGPVQGVAITDDRRPLGRAATIPGVDPGRLPLRRLSDHTFAGPDYSMLPDTEFPNKLDWMYEVDYRDLSKLTPYQHRTLTALRHRNRAQLREADSKRYQLLSNAVRLKVAGPQEACVGERISLRADVKSLVSGHSVPTGFTAERQLWVWIEVRDPRGKVVFSSGDLDHNADLRDDHSHEVLTGKTPFDKYLLNFQNKFTALNHKGTERTVVLSINRNLAPISILRPSTEISTTYGRPSSFRVAKGSLPPLKIMGQKYPIKLGKVPGPYTVEARLQFRHLPPTLLDHIGVPHLKHLLEVVVIDRHQSVIYVHPK